MNHHLNNWWTHTLMYFSSGVVFHRMISWKGTLILFSPTKNRCIADIDSTYQFLSRFGFQCCPWCELVVPVFWLWRRRLVQGIKLHFCFLLSVCIWHHFQSSPIRFKTNLSWWILLHVALTLQSYGYAVNVILGSSQINWTYITRY